MLYYSNLHSNLPGQCFVKWWDGGLLPFTMQSMGNGFTGSPRAFRAARITTLLFGLATLPVLIIRARTILVWMAGFLMLGAVFCLNPLLLRDSTYISPDILAGFFTTSAPVRQYAWFAATAQLTFSRASWQVWRPLRSITPVSLLWRFRPRT